MHTNQAGTKSPAHKHASVYVPGDPASLSHEHAYSLAAAAPEQFVAGLDGTSRVINLGFV